MCMNQALIAEKKALGRLRKETVEQIEALSSQGFTATEIAEKLGVSRNTVSKYAARTPGKGYTAELEIIFEAFFGLLRDLNTSALLDREDLAAIVDDRALEVTKKLLRVNKELAKKMLDLQVLHLKSANILDLVVPQEELCVEDLSLRKEWMALLKKQYPEKLAELV